MPLIGLVAAGRAPQARFEVSIMAQLRKAEREGRYSVTIVERPENWVPRTLGDCPGKRRKIAKLGSFNDYDAAEGATIEFNQSCPLDRWAVIYANAPASAT